MIDLVFANPSFNILKKNLLQCELETCAVALANVVSTSQGFRLLINQIYYPAEEMYQNRTTFSSQLKPEFIVPIAKCAKNEKKGIVIIHSHPGAGTNLNFSHIDDMGERHLTKFLHGRNTSGPHTSLVLSKDVCCARTLGTDRFVRVLQVGRDFEILFDSNAFSNEDIAYDRQIRAFGKQGQNILKKLKIGIVGLGGTGSVIAQQLAYLGVENYFLIDPDIVDKTNLNRLVGATTKDVGSLKIKVAARHIRFIRPKAKIVLNRSSVLEATTAMKLVDTDFFFCCTDSYGSRAVLNQLAYQYFLPCIDMGVSIANKGGVVTHVVGRIQMLAPGLGCLTCGNLLDPDGVRYDLMSSYQRRLDPYFIGSSQPEPAVISLNSTVASLAISMFLGSVVGIPIKTRYLIYQGINGKVRPVEETPTPACIVCSENGALGKGNEWPLPARQL